MMLRSGKMSTAGKKVKEDSQVGARDEGAGAGTSNHANSLTSEKNPAVSRRYPAVCDDALLHIFKKMDPNETLPFSRSRVSDGFHEMVAPERSDLLIKKAAPRLVNILPQEALLKSRKLSHSWATELNHHLQGEQFQVRLPCEMYGGRNNTQRLVNVFQSSEEIQSFLKDMGEHPGNPFPGSTVELSWKHPRSIQNWDEFWTSVTQLLEKFGSRILHFRFFDNRTELIALANNLRNCLLKLPNLKRLSMIGNFGGFQRGYIEDWFRANPFPRLPNLEMLDTLKSGIKSNLFIRAVCNSCAVPTKMRVLSLQYSEDPWDLHFIIPDSVLKFVNLEVLKGALDIDHLRQLKNFVRLPPLREVTVTTRLPDQTLFGAMEPFGSTLVELTVSRLTYFRQPANINLPNLKKLNLPRYFGSLDPFVQLTSLAHLRVGNDFKMINTKQCKVSFPWTGNRMYGSNIWELIPSLNSIQVGKIFYERKYLKRFRESMNQTRHE